MTIRWHRILLTSTFSFDFGTCDSSVQRLPKYSCPLLSPSFYFLHFDSHRTIWFLSVWIKSRISSPLWCPASSQNHHLQQNSHTPWQTPFSWVPATMQPMSEAGHLSPPRLPKMTAIVYSIALGFHLGWGSPSIVSAPPCPHPSPSLHSCVPDCHQTHFSPCSIPS